MYRGFWLWEAQFVVFYEGLRLWGGSVSKGLGIPGGSAKEGPHVRGGSELGSYEDLMNVSRILALGGSICRILRVWKALGGHSVVFYVSGGALGGSRFRQPKRPGGSGREGPYASFTRAGLS